MILHLLLPKIGKHNIGKVREVERIKRIKEVGKIKRFEEGKGDHHGKKINLIDKKNSGFEKNIYYYIIYQCYQKQIIFG